MSKNGMALLKDVLWGPVLPHKLPRRERIGRIWSTGQPLSAWQGHVQDVPRGEEVLDAGGLGGYELRK